MFRRPGGRLPHLLLLLATSLPASAAGPDLVDLVVVRGPWPTLPVGADRPAAPVSCPVHVTLLPEGTAGAVHAECPEPFAGSAEVAARGWAWRRDDGGSTDGLVRTLRFRFGGPPEPAASEDGVALPLTAWALPRYPRTAAGVVAGGEARCDVEATLDPSGAVVAGSIRVTRCGPLFVDAVQTVVAAWRWERPAGDRPLATRFGLVFHGAEPAAASAPLSSRVETVAALPIEVVHQVPPEIPPAARALGPGTLVRCEVDVVLKASGAPDTLTATACPPELTPAVLDAVKRWRWARTRPDAPSLAGLRTRATVSVRIP
jgi:hypothetical protein